MPSLPRIRSRRAAPGRPVAEPRPGPAELSAGGVTWVHLLGPTTEEAQQLATRFGWHPLDVEDVLSRRQRPKVDVYDEDDRAAATSSPFSTSRSTTPPSAG